MIKVVINKSCETEDIALTLPVAKALKEIDSNYHITYICTQKKGNIQLNEREDVAWIEKKDLIKYDFAEGDKEIISLL